MPGNDWTPKQVKERLDKGEPLTIIDIREAWEVSTVKLDLPAVRFIPMKEIPRRLGELPKEQDIVVHCHHGSRSAQVVAFMRSRGFERAWNMAGGIDQWAVQVEKGMMRY